MSEAQLETTAVIDEFELPRRPPRRLLTPVRGVLAAVVLAAAGFIGGVEVQKAQGTTQAAAPAQGRAFAPGAGFGGQQQDATVGTVKTKDGHTLYVQTTDGTLTKVTTDANSKVTRSAGSTVGRIQPGDNVVVQGSKSASGSVKATRITATAAGVAGARRGGPPGP